jgi:plasmid stabilization system protein ParE
VTITVTPRAARDIEEIQNYIAAENPTAARKVALQLFRAIDLIDSRPNIGRPTSNGRRREWSVPALPYIIPYRVDGKDVIILRVFHTSRLRPKDWSQ